MRSNSWVALSGLFGILVLVAGWTSPVQSQKLAADLTLSQRVAKASKVSEEDVNKVLRAIGPALLEDIRRGKTVDIPGFGSFRVVRVGGHRDMVEGLPIKVPARNTVEFLPSAGLSDAANAAGTDPAVTVPPFEYIVLPGQTPSQKTDYIRTNRRH
ncbi:MAG: HU family DNA-binding protein [Gemmataceae bacterium]